jgi:hypothetical protein
MKLAIIRKLDFKFSNLMHSALVSISGTEDKMFIHIQFTHSFIKKIFGIEHIRFYSQGGEIKLQDTGHPFVYQVAQLVTSRLSEEIEGISKNTLRAV